jgi:hypothetical protein
VQRLDVIVARHQADFALVRAQSVLGRTTVEPSGVVRGAIDIVFDMVNALIEERRGSDPALHDLELARALGRVLAHEIGHVLLGSPSYHDQSGLMRATFPANDLARLDRQLFRLTDRSADRLRARIAGLSDARSARCATSGY